VAQVSTTSNSVKPDLGSLRIDEGKRRGRNTGKMLGAFAAILGLAVIVTGGNIGPHEFQRLIG